MNSRKLIALFMVLALTGSALAASQQRLYHYEYDDETGAADAEASGVTAVQQHSVFIEIIVEDKDKQNQIHEFAAVVGLIKKCSKTEQNFDNAVLWFNDQFLFGDKRSEDRNESGDGLGYQEKGSWATDGNGYVENGARDADDPDSPDDGAGIGYVGETGTDARWGGCYTPNGFANAIGSDDPFGTFTAEFGNQKTDQYDLTGYDDNMDLVKQLITLDNSCMGCVFEYHSTFYVVDPNDHNWVIDKFVYPVSVLGNLFHSGSGDNCGPEEESSITQFEDPREYDHDQHHADRCQDWDDAEDDDRQNHCKDGARTCSANHTETSNNSTLLEPLFTTHLQTADNGLGYWDNAPFRYNPVHTSNTNAGEYDAEWNVAGQDNVRNGTMYPKETSENRAACEDADGVASPECAIEYNFLLAVDFAAFDDNGPDPYGPGDPSVTRTGENEIDRGCAKEHGTAGENQTDEWWEGNSHPHNPNSTTPSPKHCHPTVNLDIFYNAQAPDFVHEYTYWDTETGQVDGMWGEECISFAPGETPDDPDNAGWIDARTPIVCDADRDTGEFHAHDGTQTPRPAD